MRVFIFFILLLISSICKAQNDLSIVKVKSDSLAIVSRLKADKVLSHFDSIVGVKLLYSLSDKEYYVITNTTFGFKEYFITLDSSSNINGLKKLRSKKKDKKFLRQAFDLTKYHLELVTIVPEATYVRGEPSYFVVKDEKGKRYGEFNLSMLTVPNPIDGKIYGYLVRRITEEIVKNKKAAH
jgi:hypothetical protein